MLTYYYILAQNYAKDCLKKFHNDRQGLNAVEIMLIVGIAAILLLLVLNGGKALWQTANQKATDLIK